MKMTPESEHREWYSNLFSTAKDAVEFVLDWIAFVIERQADKILIAVDAAGRDGLLRASSECLLTLLRKQR
jgi:hypothetical protein